MVTLFKTKQNNWMVKNNFICSEYTPLFVIDNYLYFVNYKHLVCPPFYCKALSPFKKFRFLISLPLPLF